MVSTRSIPCGISDKDATAQQEKDEGRKTVPAEKPRENSARPASTRNAANILSRKRKADADRSAATSRDVAKVKREASPRTSAANANQALRPKSVAAAHAVPAMRAAAHAQVRFRT